jgi:urease accessory protein
MALLQAIEPVILDTAGRAQSSTLDDLGSAAPISDILSARHENLGIRLFRS